MRPIGILALWALVGCYSPAYRDCEITCGTGTCPSGLVCDQGICRTAGFSGACGATTEDARLDMMADADIDGPPNDVDGDGVLNVDDNCPLIDNAGQYNEDGDATGDVCDPCPIGDLPADDADTDGDGVGDGCDPDNGPVNRIAIFEGFGAPTLPPGAEPSPPQAFTFTGGAVRMTTTPSGVHALFWPQPNNGNNASDAVLADFTINRVSQQQQTFTGIGVAQNVDPNNAGVGVGCWPGQYGPFNADHLYLFSFMGDQGTSVPRPHDVGTTTRIRLLRNAQSYECLDIAINASTTSNMNIPTPATPMIGIAANDYDATFHWVMVVSRPQ